MSAKMNVPELRFGEFSGEWVEKKIKSILLDSRLGGNYSNSEKKNTNPLIKMGNLDRGKIVLSKLDYINETDDINELDKIIYGDLFFNTRNTLDLVGKVAIWKNEIPQAYYNSNLMWLKFENNFFMNYRFNSFEAIKALRRIATGTTSVAAIYTKDLLKISLFLPLKPEQEKIASFLSSVDSKIEQLSKKKRLLEQYKKGVMQKIFSQELRFQNDDGSEFPEWVEKKLGEIVLSINNGTSLTQNNEQSGYKVSRIETISDATININKIGYVSTDTDLSNYKLNIGDMLFSNINSVKHIGKIAYIDKEYNLYHGMNLLKIRMNKNSSDSKFVYYLLTSKKYKNYFETICNQAVSQASINQTDLKKTKLLLPSLKEQTKIATFLSSLDKKIELTNKELNTTKEFKKALLQKMFV